MNKKVIITVGGTGGHIFPAMALARQLKDISPTTQLLFVGGGLRSNRYFDRASFAHQEIRCSTLSICRPVCSLFRMGNIAGGLWQSHRLLRSFKPDLIVGFGSYHTFPVLLAAHLRGVPFILHEANRIPGKVNRLFSPYAALTGVHFPDTAYKMKGKVVEIPMPLRYGFKNNTVSSAEAKTYFQLHPERTTLLVFGGSQGAKRLNQLVADAIPLLPAASRQEVQLLHFTGDDATAEQLRTHYIQKGIRATVRGFEARMDLAWQAADFMISRAGASTIAEQMEFEVPGILIPFPQATDKHQDANADFMVNIVKGAEKYVEKDLDAGKLAEAIENCLDSSTLHEMHNAMQYYKRAANTRTLSDVVMGMLEN